MTKTFERFLRTLDDDDLTLFAADRRQKQAPYWRTLSVALRIEMSRRGLGHDASSDISSVGSQHRTSRDVPA